MPFEVYFASYGTGAATFAELGHQVIDLQLPEENPFLDTFVRSAQLIRKNHPDLVVSHEEFAVLPAARALGIPTAFITDWFLHPKSLVMQTLMYADEIIFIGERDIFEEPAFVRHKVSYVGPVIRQMSYSRSDKARARRELYLSDYATIISVIPGSWATEERAPIAELLVPAFEALTEPERVLVWIAGQDYDTLSTRFAEAQGVFLKRDCWPTERLVVASDLVITKANRGTTLEVSALGVPSISISHGLNPIDDSIVSRIPTNTAFRAASIDSNFLGQAIRSILAKQFDHTAIPVSDGATLAAKVLASCIRKCSSHNSTIRRHIPTPRAQVGPAPGC